MKRVFIAVKVDPGGELLRMISSLKVILADESIKWVDPANIHLTLAFLGDTEEKRIKELNKMLKDKCSGFGGFSLILAGTGVFKSFRDPRVIWAGIQPSEKLSLLNNIIAEGLKINGFSTGEKPFSPHITLGRVKSIKDTGNLKTALEQFRDQQFQIVQVNDVVLFESILMQPGPLYISLGKFPLEKIV